MMFNLLAIIGGTAIGNAMYLRFFPQYVHDAAQPQPKQGDHGSAQPHLQQGYSYSLAHMTTAFRRVLGITPSEWVRMMVRRSPL